MQNTAVRNTAMQITVHIATVFMERLPVSSAAAKDTPSSINTRSPPLRASPAIPDKRLPFWQAPKPLRGREASGRGRGNSLPFSLALAHWSFSVRGCRTYASFVVSLTSAATSERERSSPINVLLVLSGDNGGLQTDEYDFYWTPSNGNTPFLNADRTGSTFTQVLHDTFDATSTFNSPIDPSFDALVYFKGDDDWDDVAYAGNYVANIENFANTGKVVLITGMDVIASESDDVLSGLAGGTTAIDSSGLYAYANYGNVDTFSTDLACEPLLDGPFGTLYGTFPDLSPSGFPGLNDTDTLMINYANGDDAIPCLRPSSQYILAYGQYWYDNFDDWALFSVRQMDNGGVIIFMALSSNEYDNLGDGFYSIIINNILSYATLGGAGGDPHIVGFDKSSLDLLGNSGDVFNIITDQDLQVNTRLWTPEGNAGLTYQSFMGAMAFMTAAGDTIVVDAGAHDGPATVTINGEVLIVDEVTSLEGLSFHMERTRTVPKVPMMLGSAFGSEPTNALILLFERYAFEIYFVRTEGRFTNLYFVDFEVSLLSQGHAPHGIVGRTLMVRGTRSVTDADMGSQEDLLVRDGLLGTDFIYNRFEAL